MTNHAAVAYRGGIWHVEIDGVDVTDSIREVRVQAHGRQPSPVLTLALDVTVIDLKAPAANVVLGDGVPAVLEALGWKPPAEAP